VFPTAVGMNRRITLALPRGSCVPHSRGDEPCPAINRFTK